MNIRKSYIGLILAIISLSSCKKEITNQYEINEVTLYSSASEKRNLKSNEQFISVMYSDVFDRTINTTQLNALNTLYTSFGDKSVAIDVLTKSLISNSDAQIPDKTDMLANKEQFIEDLFKRFYIRKPSAQESWFISNEIEKDTALVPLDIVYAMLTSEEYRYY